MFGNGMGMDNWAVYQLSFVPLVTGPSDTVIPEFGSGKKKKRHDMIWLVKIEVPTILDSKAERQILTFLDHLDPRVALGI